MCVIVVTVYRKDSGFTLVEVMVAIAILFISMFAVLYALGISVEHNMKNLMTDEAVKISEQTMNELRNSSFGSLADGSQTVSRTLRNVSVSYTVSWVIQNLSANSRAIQVEVRWTWKGMNHRHTTASIVSSET